MSNDIIEKQKLKITDVMIKSLVRESDDWKKEF